MKPVTFSLSAALVSLLMATPASAQHAYPAKGQSPEQQAKDGAECSDWARRQTGYDPAAPPPTVVAQPAPVTGSGARVRGAARGAAVGAIAGGDVGDAAVAGAAIGGVARRSANRRAAASQNQAIAQQTQANRQSYTQARGACLTGRGYSVN